jgi:pyruvate/2-oxoacid:ferredoxin oxidoreductase alpha subunit/NAD-dependent dihydropyrimidine dehydrogenase PreA subunit
MSATTPNPKPKGPRPALVAECCKGCGRCIDACAHHCIVEGAAIHAGTGLVPVTLHLEACTACGLCFDACPEPYGLRPEGVAETHAPRAAAAAIPDEVVALPPSGPLVVKGNHAAAIGAILAGCRHVFGYPITPSTEGAELLAKVMPSLGGVFLQAPSEVATVNMMYGCGGAGLRSITFTSSPGFSLMLEGISYMVGAEVPGVFVNVMRGGPGLGNIAPEQSDVKLACRGLGHGNTHAIVLAPATPQEMLDLTLLAFDLAFAYRNPVVVLADGYLGQMTGRVELPAAMVKPGLPAWAVWGDGGHRGNLIASIYLLESDLEDFNRHLNEKYARMAASEQRAELYRCEDAEVVVVAANTPARMARAAVETLRAEGVRAGLFRPVTLWPFPVEALRPVAARARRIVVAEAGPGQIEDEMRLALSHAGLSGVAIESVRRYGGVLPQPAEIVGAVRAAMGEEVRG